MQKNKGIWKVDGVEFDNKLNAILQAQKNNSDVTFHYNDEWWDPYDWTVEPPQSLEELYIARAKQIREKYETVIIRFSGGADSVNILNTFITNNIKFDVIAVNTYTKHLNIPHESHKGSLEKVHNVYPYLNKLREQGINFVLKDIDTSCFFDLVKDPSWIYKVNAPRFRLSEVQASRVPMHPELNEYNRDSTCIVSGIDKPYLHCLKKSIWCQSIPDFLPALVDPGHSSIVQEPFYWTADMPELPIKQSHAVKNYVKSRPDILAEYGDKTVVSSKNFLVPIIYPHLWNFTPGDPLPYFNIPLNPKLVMNDGIADDQYEKNVELYQAHHRSVELIDQLVESRFKKSNDFKKDGLRIIYSKNRWLGK